MAQSPVRADFHKSLDIYGNRFAQISFDHPISLDDAPDAHCLLFGQILYLRIEVDAGLLTNFRRPALADSINVSQTDLNSLAQRQIHSCDSSQFLPPY